VVGPFLRRRVGHFQCALSAKGTNYYFRSIFWLNTTSHFLKFLKHSTPPTTLSFWASYLIDGAVSFLSYTWM
jgi:hypothetical protein